MDVEKLKKILEEEYGISNDKELEQAIEKYEGLDVGIFTSPKWRNIDESVA